MSRSLRRSSRLKDKTTVQYVDYNTDDSEFKDGSESECQSSQSVYTPSDGEEAAHCVCGDGNDDRMMICCDRCNMWYHPDCAKLTLSAANRLAKSSKKWFCPKCKSSIKTKAKQSAKSGRSSKSKKPAAKKKVKPTRRLKRKRREMEDPNLGGAGDTDGVSKRRRISVQQTHDIPEHQPIHQQLGGFSLETAVIPNVEGQQINGDDDDDDNDCESPVIGSIPDVSGQTASDLEMLSARGTATNSLCSATDAVHEQNGEAMEAMNVAVGDATDCRTESGSEDEIEIQAGDQWVGSSSFLKKKESIPSKTKVAAQREEESDDGEDFVVLNANKTSKQDICPLTLQKIEDPVRNILCRHIYERRAIANYKEYFKKKRKRATKQIPPQKCPQGGCQALLIVHC